MTMSDDDKLIDEILAEARATPPAVPEGLMARVLADAAAETAARAPAPKPARAASGLVAWFGGWPGLAGLSTAAAAGVFIGFAAPQGVNTLAATVDPATSTFFALEPVTATLSDLDEWSLEDG